jgi:hypothetical protein
MTMKGAEGCRVLHRIALAVVSEWYQEVMDYHSSNTPE